mmetsp:Transcript_8883/g.13315  ORF Transcript_8883/g.13315 Transcript_8883/m.13315 type:complete len:483 (+) Transcript_8883:153-1601(+)
MSDVRAEECGVWEERYSDKHKRKYWVNKTTRRSSWVPPALSQTHNQHSNGTDGVKDVSEDENEEGKWVNKYSQKHARPYWRHSKSGEVIWKRPADANSPALRDRKKVVCDPELGVRRLQARVRGIATRRVLRVVCRAAIILQRTYRGYLVRKSRKQAFSCVPSESFMDSLMHVDSHENSPASQVSQTLVATDPLVALILGNENDLPKRKNDDTRSVDFSGRLPCDDRAVVNTNSSASNGPSNYAVDIGGVDSSCEVDHLKQQIARLESERDETLELYETLSARIGGLEQSYEDSQQEIRKLNRENEELLVRLSSLEEKSSSAVETTTKMSVQNAKYLKRIQNLQAKIRAMEKEKINTSTSSDIESSPRVEKWSDMYKQKISMLENQVRSLEIDTKEKTKDLEHMSYKYNRLKSKALAVRDEKKKYEGYIDILIDRVKELETVEDSMESKLETIVDFLFQSCGASEEVVTTVKPEVEGDNFEL